MVIDGDAFISHIYHATISRETTDALQPYLLYNKVRRTIEKLREYNFNIIRVFLDGLWNYDKLSTYLGRYEERKKANEKYWESGLRARGRNRITFIDQFISL